MNGGLIVCVRICSVYMGISLPYDGDIRAIASSPGNHNNNICLVMLRVVRTTYELPLDPPLHVQYSKDTLIQNTCWCSTWVMCFLICNSDRV